MECKILFYCANYICSKSWNEKKLNEIAWLKHMVTCVFDFFFKWILFFGILYLICKGNKSNRGIRVSSYDRIDPDDSASHTGTQQHNNSSGGYVAPKTLGNQRKFMPGSQGSSRVSTISQNYNEKTMLLSSDDEYQ